MDPTATQLRDNAEYTVYNDESAVFSTSNEASEILPLQALSTIQTISTDYFWRCGIASLTIQTHQARPAAKDLANKPHFERKAQASRWRTPEFYVYYAILVFGVWKMITVALHLSRGLLNLQRNAKSFMLIVQATASCIESNPTYWMYSRKLSPGWIFGRKVVSLINS